MEAKAEVEGSAKGEGEAGGQVAPIPHSLGLELWLAPRGRLGCPFVQLSLTISGSTQARFHPQGLCSPLAQNSGCPPFGLLFSQPLHPREHSLHYLHAVPWLPLVVPTVGTMMGSSLECSGPRRMLEVRGSLLSPAVAGPGALAGLGRLCPVGQLPVSGVSRSTTGAPH